MSFILVIVFHSFTLVGPDHVFNPVNAKILFFFKKKRLLTIFVSTIIHSVCPQLLQKPLFSKQAHPFFLGGGGGGKGGQKELIIEGSQIENEPVLISIFL